jgi:electron transport complex protein RnfD
VLWLFGILGTVALAMGAAVLIEYVTQMVLRQPYRAGDGHGALMGLLLALMMPPTVPWWVLLVGVAVAIIIGKQIYGGIGGYPMHPAVVGWLVLMLSWPTHIYPVGAASIAAPTVTAALATLAGGLVLWWAGIIRLQIPLGFLFGVAVFALLFQSRLNGGVLDQLLTGHVLLGAFFLATDSTTSPANGRAMWVYGIATGMLVMLVRAFGIWPDAVPFAVLLMCALSPLVDKLRPRLRPLEASR